VISVAHHGDVGVLSDALAEREQAPRKRLPVVDIAQFGGWKN